MGYLTGFLEGFQGRRNEVHAEALKADESRRASEGRLYEYLLASRDPEIRALALHGLFESAQPSAKKGGFRGYLGELQTSSVYPQIRELANQLIPDPTPTQAPAAPAAPGAAAMSTNAPVSPGSAPITQPTPAPTFAQSGLPVQRVEEPTFNPPPSEPDPAVPTPPTAPQPLTPAMDTLGMMPPVLEESKFKRRGTQVPTAEEIAEYQARIPLQTRISMADQFLPPDLADRATMGILGAPMSSRTLTAVNQWGVRLQPGGPVLPVLLDQDGGYKMANGQPIPATAEMVRMGGGGSTGSLTSYVEDTPEQRAQLLQTYPGISLPAGQSPTGYLRIRATPDGQAMAIPSEFTPPPAYSGTTEILAPGTDVPVRVPVLREGGIGAPLGDAPQPGPVKAQTDAQGLLAAVDKMVQAEGTGTGGLRRAVPPARIDAIVKQEAGRVGLPYQTYAELQIAAKSKPEASPRTRQTDLNTGKSMADRIRERALKERGQIQGATPAPVAPAPSARSQGPGPRR